MMTQAWADSLALTFGAGVTCALITDGVVGVLRMLLFGCVKAVRGDSKSC